MAKATSLIQPRFLHGRWVYWSMPVSGATIAARHLERGANAFLTALLGTLGLAGVVLLLLVVRDVGVFDRPWEVFSLAAGDVRLFGFVLTLFVDLYLLYRFQRQRENIGTLPPHGAEANPPATTDVTAENVGALHRDERFDMASALTPEAVRAIEDAWHLSKRYKARDVAPAFLFASLLSFGKVSAIRARLSLPNEKLVGILRQLLTTHAHQTESDPRLSGESIEVFFAAYEHAWQRRAVTIDVTDLFAALALATDDVRAVLDELEVTPETIENVVAWITIQDDLRQQWGYFQSRARFKPKGTMDRAMTAIATPLLDRFSNDLTLLARRGVLHPCIAREKELDEIFRVLEGKKNILLVGNPGVGKTAIIEGIAQRMVTEDVPEALEDKRLVSLSIPRLLSAQTRFGGPLEIFQQILTEVTRAGNVVLVLDNIQNLVGMGSGAAFDLSEVVGAALANNAFHAIATTNPVDYRRYVESAPAIMSAFEATSINEMEPNSAIKVLEAHASAVEYERHVYFSYASIEKLVTLSTRYLHDRYLPQKALTLMEEVAVAVHKERGTGAVVSGEDVAAIVAQKTNVSVTQVAEDESEKLMHLEERIHERIVGQDEAVRAVSAALRRARVELRDPSRPIATFLFLGPTGVGKTELAKTLAAVYFGAEQQMIRLDMSEYQDPMSTHQLLGMPGGTTGGYLTDAVRGKPFSLLLLDELEKAHPDVLNLFLQVMDDGRLTDAAGRTVDFTNVIIIATSNAGTQHIQDGISAGATMEAIQRSLSEEVLPHIFRPEFLNRFDQIVVFKPLSRTQIVAITKLLLDEVAARLAAKGITLVASDAAVRELADAGYDPLYGARPMRRLIQDRVDDALAKYLLTGKLGRRDRAILEPGGAIRIEEAPRVWKQYS